MRLSGSGVRQLRKAPREGLGCLVAFGSPTSIARAAGRLLTQRDSEFAGPNGYIEAGKARSPLGLAFDAAAMDRGHVWIAYFPFGIVGRHAAHLNGVRVFDEPTAFSFG